MQPYATREYTFLYYLSVEIFHHTISFVSILLVKRPVIEYCVPLYHHALPDYLSKDIERIQKRALSIFSPGLSYDDSLSMFNMATLGDRRIDQCEKLFDSIVSNPDHKLHHFLPSKNYCH